MSADVAPITTRMPDSRLRRFSETRIRLEIGHLYDGNTLHDVWPRVRPVPTQWWWRESPPPPKAPRTPQAEPNRG